MLVAYAKSMFSMGWRYEHAVGARRNLNEAARCYWKAARLGDPSAAARLGRERPNALGYSAALPLPPAPGVLAPSVPGLDVRAPAALPPLAAVYSSPPLPS